MTRKHCFILFSVTITSIFINNQKYFINDGSREKNIQEKGEAFTTNHLVLILYVYAKQRLNVKQ